MAVHGDLAKRGTFCGTSDKRTSTPQSAKTNPIELPSTASSMLSVKNWQKSLQRLAPIAIRGACQHEARDVGAGNEQNEPHGAEEHPKGRAHVAHHMLVQRHEVHSNAEILFWIFLLEPRGDRAHVGASDIEASCFLQTGDNA